MLLSPVKITLHTTDDELREKLKDTGLRDAVVNAIVGTFSAKDFLRLEDQEWDEEDSGVFSVINENMRLETADESLRGIDRFRLKGLFRREVKKHVMEEGQQTEVNGYKLHCSSRAFIIHVCLLFPGFKHCKQAQIGWLSFAPWATH